MSLESSENQTIVFFDGYCGLCSGVVDFLIERDRDQRLSYSPLQGETAKTLLNEKQRNDLDTVVVVTRDLKTGAVQPFEKSDAVFEALSKLSNDWAGMVQALRVFPKPFRNVVYDIIARNRFKLFGRRDSCRAPTAEERKLFLP